MRATMPRNVLIMKTRDEGLQDFILILMIALLVLHLVVLLSTLCSAFIVPKPSHLPLHLEYNFLHDSPLVEVQSSSNRLSAFGLEELEDRLVVLKQMIGDGGGDVIVSKVPAVLAYNPDEILLSFSIYKETYGEEKARAIVTRNPLLLGLNEQSARRAGDGTWALSYVIDVTRGAGGVLLGGLGLALLVKPIVAAYDTLARM